MQIIGGIVSYEDGVKTVQGDQFSPTRKVRVELNFSLSEHGDDADASVSAVLDKAQAFVNGKLGIAAPTAAAKSGIAPVKPIEASEPPKITEQASKPRAPRAATAGKTKDDLAKAAGLPAEAPKPVDPDELVPSQPDGSSALIEAAGVDDLLGEAPKEITDADLNHAIQQKMQEINSPENPGGPRIRGIVKEFIADKAKQPVARDIPQADRGKFLEKLKELKK